jgi:hypothetical protein
MNKHLPTLIPEAAPDGPEIAPATAAGKARAKPNLRAALALLVEAKALASGKPDPVGDLE